ncbi:MAG TPA: adenylate/guanylate cyclase domain-containing protein [Acidimicrobiia bacterium]|nr:adenylate/guanylate cyclase domain-containing protein [Acidimicrobiia bacterium]
MEPWQEPVRGAPLPAAAFALPGIEQLRGLGSSFWPHSPNIHLLGLRVSQLGNASAVLSMPITPWLAHPDGVIDAGIMAATTTMVAAWTTLPPRTTIVPLQLSYSPVRRISPESGTLIGRAHVVRTAPYWVYAEGTVEDGQGRVVASTSGHYLIEDVTFAVPEQPPVLTPVDLPSYPTPDPYERPLPHDRYPAFNLFRERGGVEAITMMMNGSAPRAPLYELLGIAPVEVREGSYVSDLVTSDWHNVNEGSVHPSILAAFCADNCGATTWSLAGPGVRLASLQMSLGLARSVLADGRTLRARSEAEWIGERVIASSLRLFDGDEVIGIGSMTNLIQPAAERPPEPSTRLLATVLFTDIVDSTVQAERAGDAQWKDLLGRHHEIVRHEIQRCRGRLVKSTGDGVLVTFDSPTLGVECAKAIREAVRRIGLEIRAGLHTGDVEVAGGDVAGIGVHIASRVESAAGPGEVWVSETVRALCAGSGLSFKDQGRHALKGIDEEIQLYSVED